MPRARRNDERLDVQPGQGGSGDGIVADHGDARTEKRELLVEIPRERVKVVDQQTIDGLRERGRERRGHRRRRRRRVRGHLL